MPLYETVFIARQDIPAQEAEELGEKYSNIVGDNGGAVGRREYWGLRNLAYRIKKNRKGHYTMLHIDAPAPAVAEMERNMRIDENVLRYLTIRADELDEGPSVMMQNRRPRDDRPPSPRAPREERAGGSGGKVDAAPPAAIGVAAEDSSSEANASPKAPAAADGEEANASPKAPAATDGEEAAE